ncbi:MAG: response regulator [Rhodothermales bacterium]|jgi:DNA-binding NarL/FixJ family response regulator
MTSQSPTRVLLVDDHEIVREGCRRLLQAENDIKVIAEASSGELACRQYDSYQPDVVVMDLSLPGIGGIETSKRLLNHHPQAKIVIFTMHENPILIQKAIKIGAKGFLNKAATRVKLADAVRTVMKGEIYLESGTALSIAKNHMIGASNPLASLSDRELEIFQLITTGKSTAQAAEILHLSPKTVSNHSSRIKKKLGVSTMAELIRVAIDAGIISSM